jgi:ASCH domain-containing protein
MKVLTVRQPWAWAIIFGPKRVENRTWKTSYRGPLLIHAGRSRARLGDYGPGEPDATDLAFGSILGVVELLDCVPYERVKDRPFAEGPWCWLLAEPRPLETPFPCAGHQQLFEAPAGLILPRTPKESTQDGWIQS